MAFKNRFAVCGFEGVFMNLLADFIPMLPPDPGTPLGSGPFVIVPLAYIYLSFTYCIATL